MSRNFNGTGDVLTCSSTPVTAVALSLFCWFKPANGSTAACYLFYPESASTANYFSIGFTSTTDPNGNTRVFAQAALGGTIGTAYSSAGATRNAWNSGVAVFTNATSRTAYVNGGNSGTNATSVTPTSIAQIRWVDAGNAATLIAHCAIWSSALASGDVTSLNNGVSPLQVAPSSLVFYMPFMGYSNPEQDLVAGRTATITGASFSSDEPAIPVANPSQVYQRSIVRNMGLQLG